MKLEYHIKGGDFNSVGSASSEVKKILKQLNIDPHSIKRIVVSLYEAEVNIAAHAYYGTIKVAIKPEKVKVRLEDHGPGIPDINLAMQEGYSTASQAVREMGFGAGMGLPNIKKNTDAFLLESEVGKGTTLTFENYIKRDKS